VIPGDVVRLPELSLPAGTCRPKEGHDLVLLFLGACRLEDQPDAAAFLRGLGFQRSHVFEVTLYWSLCTTSLAFMADSPREAAVSAVRLTRFMEGRQDDGRELEGLSLCLSRLGPIGPEGKPYNGRGQTFLRWSASSGTTLDELEARCSAAASETT